MSEIKIKTIYPKQSDVTSEYNNQQQTISELQKQLKEAREVIASLANDSDESDTIKKLNIIDAQQWLKKYGGE